MALITLEPDMSIEPGHQWLVLDDSLLGRGLAVLLAGGAVFVRRGDQLLIPHDAETDKRIVALINELAHARYESPTIVQLTMKETGDTS